MAGFQWSAHQEQHKLLEREASVARALFSSPLGTQPVRTVRQSVNKHGHSTHCVSQALL